MCVVFDVGVPYMCVVFDVGVPYICVVFDIHVLVNMLLVYVTSNSFAYLGRSVLIRNFHKLSGHYIIYCLFDELANVPNLFVERVAEATAVPVV
jgi:hypothetical protein